MVGQKNVLLYSLAIMANYKKEFSKIYDQCIDKIYRFIFLKVNSEDTAKDICSETFLKGWESYKSRKIDNPQAFLYRIARNLITDYYRKKGRTDTISAEFASISDPNPGVAERVSFNSDLDQIKTVLPCLKESYQNALIWHYIEDLSIKEIAKMTGKSEPAVRVLLHRALKALKKECNKKGDFSS